MYALRDLKAKEAIDITDGRYLGQIIDAVIDLELGQLIGILLPGGLFKNDIFIPYQAIHLIGLDVVLVDLGLAQTSQSML